MKRHMRWDAPLVGYAWMPGLSVDARRQKWKCRTKNSLVWTEDCVYPRMRGDDQSLTNVQIAVSRRKSHTNMKKLKSTKKLSIVLIQKIVSFKHMWPQRLQAYPQQAMMKTNTHTHTQWPEGICQDDAKLLFLNKPSCQIESNRQQNDGRPKIGVCVRLWNEGEQKKTRSEKVLVISSFFLLLLLKWILFSCIRQRKDEDDLQVIRKERKKKVENFVLRNVSCFKVTHKFEQKEDSPHTHILRDNTLSKHCQVQTHTNGCTQTQYDNEGGDDTGDQINRQLGKFLRNYNISF